MSTFDVLKSFDIKSWLIILLVCALAYQYLMYVRPVTHSVNPKMDALRELSLKEMKPHIAAKARVLVDSYIRESLDNGQLVPECVFAQVNNGIKERLAVDIKDDVEDEAFSFEKLP